MSLSLPGLLHAGDGTAEDTGAEADRHRWWYILQSEVTEGWKINEKQMPVFCVSVFVSGFEPNSTK